MYYPVVDTSKVPYVVYPPYGIPLGYPLGSYL